MVIKSTRYQGTLESKTVFTVDQVKKYGLTFNLGANEGRVTAVWTKVNVGRNSLKPKVGEKYSFIARPDTLSASEREVYPSDKSPEAITHRISEIRKVPPPKPKSSRPKMYSL